MRYCFRSTNPGPGWAGCVAGGALALLAGVTPLVAQQTGTVQGTVIAEGTMQPVAGAQVQLAGTTIGQLTNQEGGFTISNVPVGDQEIRVTFIGYRQAVQPVQVAAGETVQVDISLERTQILMDEIVATGTGAPTERRRLGQTITSISGDELATAPLTSVQDALHGRVSGISGLAQGQSGTSAKLMLRGTASLSQRNEPLIYVDGVRIDNTRHDAGGSASVVWDRLQDINPADIQSIEVIKGAAAATLFGTEASAGVIQIFTRRGTAQSPVFTFQTDHQAIQSRPFPDQVVWWHPTQEFLRVNPAEHFVDVGYHQNYTLAVRGGTESVQYSVSGRFMDETDALPGHGTGNRSIRSALDFRHSDRLRTTLDVNVVDAEVAASNRGWSNVGSDFLLERPNVWYLNEDDMGRFGFERQRDRLSETRTSGVVNVLASGSVNYDIRADMVGRLRVGHNEVRRKDFHDIPARTISSTSTGTRMVQNITNTATTLDASVNWRTNLSPRLTLDLTVGGQSFWETQTREAVRVNDFASPTLRTLRGGSSVSSVDETQQDIVNAGVFAQQQIGLDDRFFLTLGGRLDGNSAFGDDFGLQFYPKAGLSWVVSDYDFWNVGGVEDFRIRGAIGTSGLQPGAFDAQRTWQPGVFAGGVPRVSPLNEGNPALKPERSTEREIAIEAGLLDGRVGVEAVYFNQTTTDALLPRQGIPSTGFTGSQLINIGQVDSWGVELMTSLRVMESPTFGWDLNVGATWIDQVVTDMGGVPDWRIEGRRRWGWVAEGHRPGVVIAPVQDPARRFRTSVPLDEVNHLDQIEPLTLKAADGSDSLVVMGNSLPDWTIDLGSTIRIGQNLTLRALFAGAGGFIMSNETRSLRESNFYAEEAAVLMQILDDPTASQEERLRAIETFGNEHPLVLSSLMEDGDYLKLNELTLSYQLPQAIAGRLGLGNTTLSIGGRNLVVWTGYSGLIDPGTSGGGFTGTSDFLQNIDYISAPSTRRYVVSIRTTF